MAIEKGDGDEMRVARHNKVPARDVHRAPEWAIRKWMEYYANAESRIEEWAEGTEDEAVVAFKHVSGYSRRRRVIDWLPSTVADQVLEGDG